MLSLLCAALVATIVAPVRAEDPPTPSRTITVTRVVTVPATYRGRTASGWAKAYRHRTRQLQASRLLAKRWHRTLLARPSVAEAINLAAVVYGNGSWLWRIARCESGLNPGAVNSGSGSTGLFQFLPSTWATTPYGSFSIYSAAAQALAAGWMAQQGRAREWVCR